MKTIAKCNHCGINHRLSEHERSVNAIDLCSDHEKIYFSIIMPTYNRKNCIKNAVDSLFAQTYKNFELIIIDDGSTDGTDEYMKEMYQEEINNKKIKYYKLPENKGAAFARNFGLSKALYEWIGYLDTDNKMHNDFLETFVKSIENSANEIHYAQIKCSKTQKTVGHGFNFDELVQNNFIDLGVFIHSAKTYNEIGGFDTDLLRLIDWDLIIKYTEKYPPEFIEKVLLDYNDSDDPSRITNKFLFEESYKQVILNYYKRIPKQTFIETYTARNLNLKKAIAFRDKQIADLKQEITKSESQIVDFDQKVQTLTKQLEKVEEIIASRNEQITSLQHLADEYNGALRTLEEIHDSSSWRMTAPMRYISSKIKNIAGVLKLLPNIIRFGGGAVTSIEKALRIISREGWSGVKRRILFVGGNRNVIISPKIRPDLTSAAVDRNDYAEWVRRYDTLTDSDREKMRSIINDFQKKPLISIIMPVYNPQTEWLVEAIESVCKQIYQHWELCIADDASTDKRIRSILERYAREEKRIIVVFREKNGHISAASNSALVLVTGEWVALLDHDDLFAEHALFWVANTINQHPDAGLIYSDEDKIDNSGRRFDPYFKCDWNQDLFYSHNLISHLGVYRTELLQEIGGFREGMEGSQDYDLALRCIERIEAKQIYHIPRILYHWRMHSQSTAKSVHIKPYASIAGQKALNEHFQRMKINALTEYAECGYRVRYMLPVELPLVSLIILTKNKLQLIKKCVESILKKTDYPNYEILIVDNSSDEPATLKYFQELQHHPRIRVVRYDQPFNFSALNNAAVTLVNGEIIALLNNDLEIISSEWLSEMVSHALRPGIGIVGVRLWYPDKTLQHGGVILGMGGVAGHAHKYLPYHQNGYFCRGSLIQNFSAVTAACMIIQKKIYEEVGGFNEDDFAIAFNDVDFCLRLVKAGYRNVWTPYAELYHLESASRGYENTPEKQTRFAKEVAYMKEKWGNILLNDPAYSPNLTLDYEDFSLAWPPRIEKL